MAGSQDNVTYVQGQDAGMVLLAVRQDTADTLASADGYFTPLSVDDQGKLYVTFGGSVTVTGGGTSSNFGSSFPTAGTAVGFSDGTNMVAGRAFDLDSGAGTENNPGVSLRAAASGGSVAVAGTIGSTSPTVAIVAGYPDSSGNLRGARLYDTDTGGGTEWTLGVNLRSGGSGASAELGVTGNPLVTAIHGEAVGAIAATGRNSDVDTAAEQLTTSVISTSKGVVVKADSSNAGVVYVGISTVTIATADATDGFPLRAGESVTIPVNSPSLIYVIASQNNQVVHWMAV